MAGVKILILNRGSSSLKCSLFDFPKLLFEEEVTWENIRKKTPLPLKKLKNITLDVIGHRIVHGGTFIKSRVIDKGVKEKIKAFSKFAPLHNLAELELIEKMEKNFPKALQIAVFDTAFHHTLPQKAIIYGGPYSWYEQGIRRYGFHGISFQYCARKAKEILPKKAKIVICHLGSGASLCAIKNGKSIDTTMGFTPLEGLIMDTRCGSIDPGILLYLKDKNLMKTLYDHSGLLGLSGKTSDMKELESLKDPRSLLALEIYLHQLCKQLGAMVASLQGVDGLAFTGGIGENSPYIRQRVCDNFSFLGIEIDKKKNEKKEEILSTKNSKITVLVIPTQEALEIANECNQLVSSIRKRQKGKV